MVDLPIEQLNILVSRRPETPEQWEELMEA